MSDFADTSAFDDDLEWYFHEEGETMVGWRVWLAMGNPKKGTLSLRSAFIPEVVWDPERNRSGEGYTSGCLANKFLIKDNVETGGVLKRRLDPIPYAIRRMRGKLNEPCQRVPGVRCGCGFNAFMTRDEALRHKRARHQPPWGVSFTGQIPGVLIGRIEMAGEVVEHADHVRTSWCKILDLEMCHGSRKVAAELERLYDVPVLYRPDGYVHHD